MSKPATLESELLAMCNMAVGWLRHLLWNTDDDGVILVTHVNYGKLEDDLAQLETVLTRANQSANGKSVAPSPPQNTPTAKPPPPPPGYC